MASRKRRKDKKRRKQQHKRASSRKRARVRRWVDLPAPDLARDQAERLGPPRYVGRDGQLVPDPWQVLGLPQGTTDPERIQAAYRALILEHPPEHDPEGARRLRTALDRLTSPDQRLELLLGELRCPDADAWELPPVELPSSTDTVGRHARLVAQAVVYSLLEAELGKEPTPGTKAQLNLF